MTTLPSGAGPEAGTFSGTIYLPPAAGVTTTDPSTDPTSSTTRPQVATATAATDSKGRMVAVFTPNPARAWLVRRIVVQSTVRGQALVYVGTIDPTNLVSGTIAGDLDENDANQPYVVPEGSTLSVYWVAGGTCTARVEYEEI